MAGRDGGFDPHDPEPPDWARLPAAEVVRRAVEPDAVGVLRRRKPTAAPVVSVTGRFVEGRLDLRAAEFPFLLEFVRCRFEHEPDLRQARLAGVEFRDCWLPGIQGRNLRSDNDVQITDGTVVAGTVDLTDGEIHGTLVLSGAVLRPRTGPALHGDRLQLVGALLGRNLRADGEIRIPGLRSGGNVNFAGARLHNPRGLGLNGNGMQVGGNLHLVVDPDSREPFRCDGTLFLPSVRVDSDFSLRGARLTPRTEHSRTVPPDDPFFDPNATLVADRCRVDGNVNLDRDFSSTGTIRVVNAHIGGSLRLSHARVDLSGGAEPFVEQVGSAHRPPGPYADRAVHLDGTEVRGGIDARDARIAGQLRLVDVKVQGSVLLDRAVLSNRRGDAIEGRRFSVGGNLDGRALLVFGSILLPGSRIGANLDLRGSRLVAPGSYARDASPKPSLDLRVAHIGRDLICADGDAAFSAQGEIRMRRAEVLRETNFHGAVLGNGHNDVALNAFGVQTPELRLDVAAPPRGRVDLRHLRCAFLTDNERFWQSHGRIELEDFRYDALRDPIALDDDAEVERRLRWLRHGMRDVYRPGPYEQMAHMLRAAGNEEHAATVLVEKQRRRYNALADGSGFAAPGIRLWSWLQRWMVGYGYRPTRALAWLSGFLIVGTLWFALIPRPHEANADDHLVWNPVLYTLDLLVPIVDFGHKNKWTVVGPSQWISAALIALGWILATTVAAGVTRMLRRSS
ncbi:hypothetical protein V5P93_007315 [Actinokineospora auranticolor]|uniref:Membrane-associated oxidoreductase n=1 Tax=Actinokineospora auranticolor TaxID=155976 RepID=A0A2S6GRZ2_9PSEU|nr:hypothetical protein [Actinokineospora auranticolor]PPK67969.1 hypothetical protein CLV40_106201 [Actinokineospora auranticolor]